MQGFLVEQFFLNPTSDFVALIATKLIDRWKYRKNHHLVWFFTIAQLQHTPLFLTIRYIIQKIGMKSDSSSYPDDPS